MSEEYRSVIGGVKQVGDGAEYNNSHGDDNAPFNGEGRRGFQQHVA